ncbi:MAG: helix-turn-helix domain-containing protein [Allobranchiibius sp.]|nr:helix-turn-helix domain-containing protein [Actinomycetota bacterium]
MSEQIAVSVPRLLTSAEVADALQVDRSTLCRWRMANEGPRVIWLRVGVPRYRVEDVLDWIERVAV